MNKTEEKMHPTIHKFTVRKSILGKLTLGLMLASLFGSAASAQQFTEVRDGYVVRSEIVWATRTVREPTASTRCYQRSGSQNRSLSEIVVGGLIGSAIGNKLSNQHGAGTLGAVAGILHASNGNNRQNCVRETNYTSHVEQYPSHYVIHVRAGGKRLQFDSDRPYRKNERVRLNVSSDFSLMR
jgi:uncharacterized protein YcfJ